MKKIIVFVAAVGAIRGLGFFFAGEKAPASKADKEKTESIRKFIEKGDTASKVILAETNPEDSFVPIDAAMLQKLLEIEAEQDEPIAAYMVGHYYYSGIIVEKNYAEAFKWFKKGAELGDADSQNMMGIYYKHGIYVNQDMEQARLWYERAAKQGGSSATYNLALFYLKGAGGVAKDRKKAYELIVKAAELGCYAAQKGLSQSYQTGVSGILPKDLDKAKYWEQKGANNMDKGSMYDE